MQKLNKLTICLDMFGCPNRCRHCWLGHGANSYITMDDLRNTAESFRPFTNNLEVFSWYREPDFPNNYCEMHSLETELSTKPHSPLHYENASIWRLARDIEYAPWLKSLGVERIQITLFGGREKTDYYTGRKGAYDDIVKAIDVILENGIAPRIQTFAFKDNVDEMPLIEDLILDMDLEKRCAAIGIPFTAFVGAPSCCGAGQELYDKWMTPEDLPKFTPLLIEHSLAHWNRPDFASIFGKPENEWVSKLKDSTNTESMVSDTPVLYLDRNFEIYPNISHPAPYWSLGNLKKDRAETILTNYYESRSTAQNARLHIPLGEMVCQCGNSHSQRLFTKGDYIDLILNLYCEREG